MTAHRTRAGQRGIVLLLALVALLLIGAVGAALMFMASSESSFVGAQKASARAFYASMGGLEEVRYRMMPSIPDAQGGLNATDTAAFARAPAIPGVGVPPGEILYVINVPNAASPANTDAVGAVPPASEDTLRVTEVPAAAVFRGVAAIQPGSGTNASVRWRWVRVNIKTELASQQDLNLDGLLDEDPVFLFMGRQYRGGDLLVYDFDGAGSNIPGDTLPPPWGRDPLAQAPPIDDRPCVAVICATPVYMLTALSTIPIPGLQDTSRLVRADVAVPAPFSLDAAVLSEPGIDISGAMLASGRDLCDPACANLQPDLVGGPATADRIFANETNFDSRPTNTVPANCPFFIPLQSQAPPGQSTTNNATARTDPECDPITDPTCICQTQVTKKTVTVNNCIQTGVPAKYDVNQLIDILRPMATVLATPVNDYYPQVGTSNLSCDPTGCQGQGVEFGGFPFQDPVAQTGPDPVNGVNADPVITYVPGDLKCTSTCTGSGILVVDGDLELSASMAFWGIVIVRGNVSVLGGGAAPTPCNIYGALITGGGVSTTLGGSICFQYNSCAQRSQSFFAPLLGLSFREVPQ